MVYEVAETKRVFLHDFFNTGFCGLFSAFFVRSATAPIDRVKVILQTQSMNQIVKSGEFPRLSGVMTGIGSLYKGQGLAALWRGNLTNVVRYFPLQAFTFAIKDRSRTIISQNRRMDSHAMHMAVNAASGALGGAGSILVFYPLDYARTRLATEVVLQPASYIGTMDCLVKTAKSKRGFFALYNGLSVSLVGAAIYRGLYFGLYDTFAESHTYAEPVNLLSPYSKVVVALTSATVASYVSFPIDTVRRRLQMQTGTHKAEWVHRNAWDCGRKIMSEEGVVAFWRGAGANVFRILSSALVLLAYGSWKEAIWHVTLKDAEATVL